MKPHNEKLRKIMDQIDKQGYKYYSNDFRKPSFTREDFNCVDERIEKNRKFREEFQRLTNKKMNIKNNNITQDIGATISELHELCKKDLMDTLNMSEVQANTFLRKHMDFNNVKITKSDNETFIQLAPLSRITGQVMDFGTHY